MDREDLYRAVVKAGSNWAALEQVILHWRREHPLPHFEALMESYWHYVEDTPLIAPTNVLTTDICKWISLIRNGLSQCLIGGQSYYFGGLGRLSGFDKFCVLYYNMSKRSRYDSFCFCYA